MKSKISNKFLLLQVAAFAVLLTVGCSKEPTASFTASNTKADVNETIKFTNTSTDAESYSWDFGDGAKSTDANPSHSYSKEGTYTVKLTATNKKKSSNATLSITVTKSNSFDYDNKNYSLTKGYLEYFGKTDDDEYEYTLILCDDGITITESSEHGTGNMIEIDLTSPSSTSLEPGTYNFSANGGSMTFDEGGVGLTYNVSDDTGTNYDISGGKVKISQDGTTYTIEISVILTNGKTVDGYYKGSLIYYDLSDSE